MYLNYLSRYVAIRVAREEEEKGFFKVTPRDQQLKSSPSHISPTFYFSIFSSWALRKPGHHHGGQEIQDGNIK